MFCVERWELPGTSRTRDERQRGAAGSVKNCILMWDSWEIEMSHTTHDRTSIVSQK